MRNPYFWAAGLLLALAPAALLLSLHWGIIPNTIGINLRPPPVSYLDGRVYHFDSLLRVGEGIAEAALQRKGGQCFSSLSH